MNFQVVCTSYDKSNVSISFENCCENDPYYALKIQKSNPELIIDYQELQDKDKLLQADILIIEDDIACILKYFYLIEQYVKEYKTPTIREIIACTKYHASNYVLSSLTNPKNKQKPPVLIILDFDLQEKENSPKYLEKTILRLQSLNRDESKIMAVSGYKGKEGPYKHFEDWLRERDYMTYRKEELDNTLLMIDKLQYYMNRSEHVGNSIVRKKEKSEAGIYERLERRRQA